MNKVAWITIAKIYVSKNIFFLFEAPRLVGGRDEMAPTA